MLEHEKQIRDYEKTLSEVKQQNSSNALWSADEIATLEKKLDELKAKVYAKLTPWQRVEISRHPKRPRSVDYIQALCVNFTQIHGDRLYRDDPAIIAGLCEIDGVKCMVVAQEKGCDTESRLKRNFGMPHPEGYRKAIRCMKVAAKFGLPILTIIDTPGAFAGLAAEERGQGWAIAHNLREMVGLPVPIAVLLIGEGCSGGALGMGIGDRVIMLEHAYYSVISPEGCASILWKDSQKKETAATALKMQVEDLLPLGIIDQVIDEPQGGAHHNPAQVFADVKQAVVATWEALSRLSVQELLDKRYEKFRRIGDFAVE